MLVICVKTLCDIMWLASGEGQGAILAFSMKPSKLAYSQVSVLSQFSLSSLSLSPSLRTCHRENMTVIFSVLKEPFCQLSLAWKKSQCYRNAE